MAALAPPGAPPVLAVRGAVHRIGVARDLGALRPAVSGPAATSVTALPAVAGHETREVNPPGWVAPSTIRDPPAAALIAGARPLSPFTDPVHTARQPARRAESGGDDDGVRAAGIAVVVALTFVSGAAAPAPAPAFGAGPAAARSVGTAGSAGSVGTAGPSGPAGAITNEAAPVAPPPGAPPMTGSSGPDGRFTLPLPSPAVVLTPFRPPATRYGSGHRGVDLAAPVGAQVRAAADGVVVYAGVLVDRGVVSVEHAGGLRTTYEPVDAAVSVGDVVARGDLLGTVAAGHPSCMPASCLHLGVRLPDRVYLDPMALFGAWRIRLKPWAGPDP